MCPTLVVSQQETLTLEGAPAEGDVYSVTVGANSVAGITIDSGNAASFDTLDKVRAELVSKLMQIRLPT